MAQQKSIWLSTSLFSSKGNWHNILREAIGPFTQSNSLVKGYTIKFNYLSGENIRLSLLTDLGNEESLAKTADKYFKNYFRKANLPDASIKLPVAGVFMPIPRNSIQYGLYAPVSIDVEEQIQYALPIKLSKIIVAALQEEIDDELILTLAFYLQISLAKTIYRFLTDVSALFSVVTPANGFTVDDNALSNLCLMKEITIKVMQTEEFDIKLRWLNQWIDDCNNNLLAISENEIDHISNIKENYHLRVQTAYHHLGINRHGEDMLSYLVLKSLEEQFSVSKQ